MRTKAKRDSKEAAIIKGGAMMNEDPSNEAIVVQAVLYAFRCGCFFPVPFPKPPYRTGDLEKWGAMRHLHDVIAAYTHANQSQARP